MTDTHNYALELGLKIQESDTASKKIQESDTASKKIPAIKTDEINIGKDYKPESLDIEVSKNDTTRTIAQKILAISNRPDKIYFTGDYNHIINKLHNFTTPMVRYKRKARPAGDFNVSKNILEFIFPPTDRKLYDRKLEFLAKKRVPPRWLTTDGKTMDLEKIIATAYNDGFTDDQIKEWFYAHPHLVIEDWEVKKGKTVIRSEENVAFTDAGTTNLKGRYVTREEGIAAEKRIKELIDVAFVQNTPKWRNFYFDEDSKYEIHLQEGPVELGKPLEPYKQRKLWRSADELTEAFKVRLQEASARGESLTSSLDALHRMLGVLDTEKSTETLGKYRLDAAQNLQALINQNNLDADISVNDAGDIVFTHQGKTNIITPTLSQSFAAEPSQIMLIVAGAAGLTVLNPNKLAAGGKISQVFGAILGTIRGNPIKVAAGYGAISAGAAGIDNAIQQLAIYNKVETDLLFEDMVGSAVGDLAFGAAITSMVHGTKWAGNKLANLETVKKVRRFIGDVIIGKGDWKNKGPSEAVETLYTELGISPNELKERSKKFWKIMYGDRAITLEQAQAGAKGIIFNENGLPLIPRTNFLGRQMPIFEFGKTQQARELGGQISPSTTDIRVELDSKIKEYEQLKDNNINTEYREQLKLEIKQLESTLDKLSKTQFGSPYLSEDELILLAASHTDPGVISLLQPALASTKNQYIGSKARKQYMDELLDKYSADVSSKQIGIHTNKEIAEESNALHANIEYNYTAWYGKIKHDLIKRTENVDQLGAEVSYFRHYVANAPALRSALFGRFNRVEKLNTANLFDIRTDPRLLNALESNDTVTREAAERLVVQLDLAIKDIANEFTHTEFARAYNEGYDEFIQHYSQYQKLKNNALYQKLNKKGLTQKQLQKYLSNYGISLDSTFAVLAKQLPRESVGKLEIAAIRNIHDKFVYSNQDSPRIDFAGLYAELKPYFESNSNAAYKLQSREALQYYETVKEFAQVFKSDRFLTKTMQEINQAKFQSFLTLNPITRLAYALASLTFNFTARLLPTEIARRTNLLHQLRIVSRTNLGFDQLGLPANFAEQVSDDLGKLPIHLFFSKYSRMLQEASENSSDVVVASHTPRSISSKEDGTLIEFIPQYHSQVKSGELGTGTYYTKIEEANPSENYSSAAATNTSIQTLPEVLKLPKSIIATETDLFRIGRELKGKIPEGSSLAAEVNGFKDRLIRQGYFAFEKDSQIIVFPEIAYQTKFNEIVDNLAIDNKTKEELIQSFITPGKYKGVRNKYSTLIYETLLKSGHKFLLYGDNLIDVSTGKKIPVYDRTKATVNPRTGKPIKRQKSFSDIDLPETSAPGSDRVKSEFADRYNTPEPEYTGPVTTSPVGRGSVDLTQAKASGRRRRILNRAVEEERKRKQFPKRDVAARKISAKTAHKINAPESKDLPDGPIKDSTTGKTLGFVRKAKSVKEILGTGEIAAAEAKRVSGKNFYSELPSLAKHMAKHGYTHLPKSYGGKIRYHKPSNMITGETLKHLEISLLTSDSNKMIFKFLDGNKNFQDYIKRLEDKDRTKFPVNVQTDHIFLVYGNRILNLTTKKEVYNGSKTK